MANEQENGDGCNLHLFERNNYFYGKLMTVRDFDTEQKYFNGKRQLINRLVCGTGIVCGFDPDDGKIRVTSESGKLIITFNDGGGGVALDRYGHEIVVPSGSKNIIDESGKDIQPTGSEDLYLYLRYKTCQAEMVNAASSQSSCDESCCPNRIREDFEVVGTTEPIEIPTQICPDHTTKEYPEFITRSLKKCPECDGIGVYFVHISRSGGSAKDDGNWDIQDDYSEMHRTYVYNNPLLADLITCHLNSANPHNLGFDVEGYLNNPLLFNDTTGLISLQQSDAITLTSDVNSITIGETHSQNKKDPHNLGIVVHSDTLFNCMFTENNDKKCIVNLDKTNAITLKKTGSNTISIGEDHSGNTKLHVSDTDRRKWDTLLSVRTGCGIAAIKPVLHASDNNDIIIQAGENIEFEYLDRNCNPITGENLKNANGIKIKSTASGGGTVVHGQYRITPQALIDLMKTDILLSITLPTIQQYGIIMALEIQGEPDPKIPGIPENIPTMVFSDSLFMSFGFMLYCCTFQQSTQRNFNIVLSVNDRDRLKKFIVNFGKKDVILHYFATPDLCPIPAPAPKPAPAKIRRSILEALTEPRTMKALSTHLDIPQNQIRNELVEMQGKNQVTRNSKGLWSKVRKK